jgi:hypothetical protein
MVGEDREGDQVWRVGVVEEPAGGKGKGRKEGSKGVRTCSEYRDDTKASKKNMRFTRSLLSVLGRY